MSGLNCLRLGDRRTSFLKKHLNKYLKVTAYLIIYPQRYNTYIYFGANDEICGYLHILIYIGNRYNPIGSVLIINYAILTIGHSINVELIAFRKVSSRHVSSFKFLQTLDILYLKYKYFNFI